MKSKSIGSLIVLAILAPSCGGGGGGGGNPRAPLTPRWTSQFRSPTTANLRVVEFADLLNGIVMGEAGTFLRTGDGGTTWTQLEYFPASLGGDVLAAGLAFNSIVAVGRSDSIPVGTVAWTSLDSTSFYVQDDAAPRFNEPWVDVSLVLPGSNPNSYRLRPSGMVDAYQSGFLFSKNSSVVTPADPWTTARGLSFIQLTGIGFVCGDSGGGDIRQTINGGDTWTKMFVTAGTQALNRLAILGSSLAYACGDGGHVVHMRDGLNWNRVPTAGGPTADLQNILFPLNENTGWVVGKTGTIFKLTFTAPSTYVWTAQTSGTTVDLYDVAFIDNNNGWVVGDGGLVLKTTNGGTTWTEVSKPPAPAPLPQFKAVDFTSNGQVGLAVGDGGRVLRTLDAGVTWTDFAGGVGAANLTGVCIPRSGSGSVAYLCGAGNTIRYHTDLQNPVAASWQTGSATTGTFEAILFPNGNLNGVCVGGTAGFYTIDGGVNWVSMTTGGTMHALAASPSGATVYAAGDGGIIRRSLDGGINWTAIPTLLTPTTTTNLTSIQAPTGSAFELFAAGANGNVYRLSAGMTPAWTSTTPLAATVPVSLAFSDDQNGLAVTQGALGGVFFTTNGGTAWNRSILHVKINAGNNLRAIRMVSSSTGHAVGDAGMIMRTTTGGQE